MHLPQDSVYGRRDGAITGLAVVPRERNNLFRSSPGFKSGVIHDVQMLPRSMMWKPPVIWLITHSSLMYFVICCKIIYILNISSTLQGISMLNQNRSFCWGGPKCAASRESFYRHPGAQTSFSSNFKQHLCFFDFLWGMSAKHAQRLSLSYPLKLRLLQGRTSWKQASEPLCRRAWLRSCLSIWWAMMHFLHWPLWRTHWPFANN